MNERVLVTGGSGFIGSHIADGLVSMGCEVAVIDIAEPASHIKNRDVSYDFIDIRDSASMRDLFNFFSPQYVIHCAAEARIQPSFENPNLYFETNVIGTRNILLLSKECGVKRVVYSASSSAYGDQKELPLREDMLLSAQVPHPYGSSKRMGEMLMMDMGRMTEGPETVCLRYFNVYGPRQTSEENAAYPTVIGLFLSRFKRRQSLPIVPSGHQRRSFIWVADVVRANLLAMLSNKVGDAEIINIGMEKNYSIWEVARLFWGVDENMVPEEMVSRGLCYMAPERRNEIFITSADGSRARELLGWEPLVSLEEGIEILKNGE